MYAHITYSVAKIFIFSVTTIMNGDFYVSFPLYDYPFELELRKCIMTKKDAFSISPTGVFWVFFWKKNHQCPLLLSAYIYKQGRLRHHLLITYALLRTFSITVYHPLLSCQNSYNLYTLQI